jgi:hypothetical protein
MRQGSWTIRGGRCRCRRGRGGRDAGAGRRGRRHRFGGLVAAGGAKPEVVAAVLIYRALTWLLPIPVGIGCYLWWRRRSWVAPATTVPSPVGAGQP